MIWGWFLRVGPFYRDICQLVASLVCETLFKRLNLVPGTPLPLPPTTTHGQLLQNSGCCYPDFFCYPLRFSHQSLITTTSHPGS